MTKATSWQKVGEKNTKKHEEDDLKAENIQRQITIVSQKQNVHEMTCITYTPILTRDINILVIQIRVLRNSSDILGLL